jgi:ABC transporter, phosphonate, periplasmic substrate-binding protein
LRGKELAIPLHSRLHVVLFVEYYCRQSGQASGTFFKQINRKTSLEDALDDVVDRRIAAVVVDHVGLRAYERRKPGRCTRLKTLCSSEKFPDSVVAYRKGVLSRGTLRQCLDGLLRADQDKMGKFLLAFWGITDFEAVPENFSESLIEIRKKYPPSLLAENYEAPRQGRQLSSNAAGPSSGH